MNDRLDLIPAALYVRVSSDRQDVDLSVAAQLRALRDYAEKNGYLVAREYVDEAESGRIADRPQFQKMLDEAAKPAAPFKEILIRQNTIATENPGTRGRWPWLPRIEVCLTGNQLHYILVERLGSIPRELGNGSGGQG